MMKEVNPEETTRAYAFKMWMDAPMPAFWKTCRKKSGNSIKHLPMNNEIISLHSHPEWRIPAARWFQGKWGIPLEEYLTSIDECIEGMAAVPQWYIMTDEGRIIAGAGVIANDFHDRKDLTPNVCALYVEPELHRHALPRHGTHLVLRTIRLGIPVHGAGRRRGTDVGTFTLHSSGNFRAGRDYQPRCSLINCADKPLARIEISLLRSDNRRPRRGQPESERIHSFQPEILSCIFHKWA